MVFVDKVLLPALGDVSPIQRQNLGLSSRADLGRFRKHNGQISYKFVSIDGSLCPALLARMREIVEQGDDELKIFEGFFFDTWAAGIKEEYKIDITHTITDVQWKLVSVETAFIDIATEVYPNNPHPLVGIPYKEHLDTCMQQFFGESEMKRRCGSRLVP